MGWAALVFIVLLAVVVYAFNRPPSVVQAQEISVDEAYQEYQAGTFFLDVREPEEWNEYHIPNTTLIPLGELSARVNELPQDQPIVVVCRSGNRSQEGRDILLDAGFEDVVSMEGGVSTWRSLGYPTEP
jgi:rhodanese-related sulfurtransferase